MPTWPANSRALNPLSRHRATRFSQISRLSRPMHHSELLGIHYECRLAEAARTGNAIEQKQAARGSS